MSEAFAWPPLASAASVEALERRVAELEERGLFLVEGLIVSPGDTLVIRVDPENVDQAKVQDLLDSLGTYLPEDVKIIAVGVEQLAVIQGEKTTEEA